MPTKAIQERWLTSAAGQKVNPDGMYGMQCVDVVDDYAETIFGVPWETCVGGVNGARDLPDRVPDEYWIRFDNDPDNPDFLPERGDVAVYEGLGVGSANEFGHTCIPLSNIDQSGADMLQQDGFAPPLKWYDFGNGTGRWLSDRPAEVVRLGWWNPGTGMIKSWLRPRPEKVLQTGTVVPPVTDAVAGYKIITDYDAEPKNFTLAGLVPAVFQQGARRIESFTFHWWGLPELHDYAGVFEHTCHYLCTNGNLTSAHEVWTEGKIAILVNHMDAAHAAGTALGNATSLHFELDPRATPAMYATAALRLRDLRKFYGDLPMRGHNSWVATRCPGNWDLKKLDALSRAPITEEELMAISAADANVIADAILNRVVTTLDGKPNTLKWYLQAQRIGRTEDVTAITKVVREESAKVQGAVTAAVTK